MRIRVFTDRPGQEETGHAHLSTTRQLPSTERSFIPRYSAATQKKSPICAKNHHFPVFMNKTQILLFALPGARRPQPRRIPSIQPSAANQGAGFWEWLKKYTRQTPTKNDFFQSTVPVFGISTREIPANTKEALRIFR